MNTKKKTNRKILLVDDDTDMCESLADVLTLDSDYDVSFISNPVKALDVIKLKNFDIVVVDYKMPEMTGLELLKKIKQFKPDLPVFILTAFISSDLIEQAKKEGAIKVLSKFIWPDEILKLIKEVLG